MDNIPCFGIRSVFVPAIIRSNTIVSFSVSINMNAHNDIVHGVPPGVRIKAELNYVP